MQSSLTYSAGAKRHGGSEDHPSFQFTATPTGTDARESGGLRAYLFPLVVMAVVWVILLGGAYLGAHSSDASQTAQHVHALEASQH
jgi:hypothetical protein